MPSSLCGVSLKNPVVAASGTYGYGVEGLVELESLGGIVGKGRPTSWNIRGDWSNV